MIDLISKFLDDPYFIKWIFNPDISVERYWEDYIEEHLGEKPTILKIKQELTLLKLKNKKLTEKEKTKLFQKIISESKKIKQVKNTPKIGFIIFRYAAIAIFCIGIGGGGVYYFLNDRLVQFDVGPLVSNQTTNEPRLIMSDGTDVVLENESNIRYGSNSEIIVDNQKLDLHNEDNRPMVMQTLIPYGSRSKIILGDSTVVYLNAGSKIIHPSRFDGNKREVVLFGEAFFEVVKNDKKPFIVKTSSLSIKVLGTRFNVSSYPEDNFVQTVLEEGSVSVKKNKSSIFEKEIVLKPNQILSFNSKTGESRVVNVNTEFYTLWRHGLLKFENQDLNRVVKKVERYYNIKIKFGEPLDGLIKISGKLDLNGSRREVFEYLSFVSDLKILEYGEDKYIIK